MPDTLTLTGKEHAEVELRVVELTGKYFPEIPPGCPHMIRMRILAERCRRLGAPEYLRQALLAPVTDSPTTTRAAKPAPRAAETVDAVTARLLAAL